MILASAKKQRLIADNYASADYISFPKRPPLTVAGRAGHARTSNTTDIYSHFLKSSDKAAARMLESVFEQEGE